MSDLQARISVRPLGDDRFVGWPALTPARVYGGEVSAQALAAAHATAPDDRLVHSVQSTFLRAGAPGTALVHVVERLRDGRSFSTRRVHTYQSDALVFTTTIGYHLPEVGLEHHVGMATVPGPEMLTPFENVEQSPGQAWSPWVTSLPEFDMRPVPADLADPQGTRRFWCRFTVPPTSDAEEFVLALYGSDVTMVSSVRLPYENSQTPLYAMTTLSHSMFFHQPFRATDWHLVEHWSPVAHGSRGLTLSRIHSMSGAMVASGVQEGLVRRLPRQGGSPSSNQ